MTTVEKPENKLIVKLLLACVTGWSVFAQPAVVPAEIRRQLEAQQEQINELRRIVEAQQKLLEKAFPPAGAAVAAAPKPVTAAAPATPLPDSAQVKAPPSLDLGGVSITPTGFLEFMQVWRSNVLSSGLPTNFAGIPFSNTVFGARRQTISSAANSRPGLRIDTRVLGASFLSLLEIDFLGYQPGNLVTTANAYGPRLRLAFVDIEKGRWEILGGQAWSLLTPGRKGISPVPANLFLTQDLDPNLQSGLVWARTPQVRAVYRPSKTVALGLSFESGDAYAGGSAGAGAITLPSAFAPDYSGQVDTGSTGAAVPNPNSDLIAKIAFDPKIGARAVHFEVAGLLNRFTFHNPAADRNYSIVGGGGSVNAGVEVVKNLSIFTNNFYSNGGGRFIFGQGPSLIIKGDGSPSLVRAMSTVEGIEYQMSPKVNLFGYYSGTNVGRSVTIDPSTGKPAGYGYTGSPNSQNRTIQEVTVGFTRIFWKNPNYGTLQFSGQYSWLVRHPWYVASGQPGAATLNMIYLNLRYLLPGSPPSPVR